MPDCIVVVQFDLPKRTEEMAVKGGASNGETRVNGKAVEEVA
jgi:hypothetical protein